MNYEPARTGTYNNSVRNSEKSDYFAKTGSSAKAAGSAKSGSSAKAAGSAGSTGYKKTSSHSKSRNSPNGKGNVRTASSSGKARKPKLYLVLLSIVMAYSIWTFIDQQAIIDKKQKVNQSVEQNIAAAENKKEELEKQIDMLGSDEYIEKIAREKIGMVKKGEKVFVDIDR